MSKADVSIIVTNFNKTPEQLMECMGSIREQTIEPLEVILVDDCSADPRAHALAISIILPKNVGVAKARDIGVKMSRGKLLLFVDADDKLAPDFIQQCGKVIASKDIAYANILLFGAIERSRLQETPPVLKPKHLFGSTNTSVLVTSMMHRRVYETLGGFRELPIYEDWDFWLRAMCKGYTFGHANTLLYYRQNLQSRNKVPSELKTTIHNKITAPYEIRDGLLRERNNGQ